MPVEGISRSQLASLVEHLERIPEPLFSEGLNFFKEGMVSYQPQQGDTISSVFGTIVNEAEPGGIPVRRSGPLSFSLTPSHLRTRYRITYFTVNFPPTTALLKAEIMGAEGEWEYEQNWVTILRISGIPYFSNPVSGTLGILKIPATGTGTLLAPQKTEQVSFPQDIVAIPGASIELELIPFTRVIRVIKQTKVSAYSLAIRGVGIPASIPSSVTSANMVYTQEFSHR